MLLATDEEYGNERDEERDGKRMQQQALQRKNLTVFVWMFGQEFQFTAKSSLTLGTPLFAHAKMGD